MGGEKITRREILKMMGASVLISKFGIDKINAENRIDTKKIIHQVDDSNYVTIVPKDTGEAMINPGMGWVCHYYSGRTGNYGYRLEPSDSLDWFPGCSVIYMRIPWSYIEPKEGCYNWTVFDTPAQRFIAKGKKMAIRINPSDIWITWATPKWVKDAGAKGVFFNHREGPSENGNLWEPDYLDPVFIEKFETLIEKLADRYDGNPNLAWIELGIGIYGEGWKMHSSPSRETNDKIVRLQIDLYSKYFKKSLICINDDMIGSRKSNRNVSLANYALTKGLTIRDDSIMVGKYPNAWHSDDLAMMFSPQKPVILETGHYGLLKKFGTWEKQRLIEAIEAYHASYLSIHWWPHEFYEENKDIFKEINKRLGYRIQLLKLNYPKSVEIGENFNIHWKWTNSGVANCYNGGYPAITIKDNLGGIVSLLVDDSFDVKKLSPTNSTSDHSKNITSRFSMGFLNPREFFNDFTSVMEQRPGSEFYAAPIVPRTEPGEYDLFVSVGQKDGTPTIALPLKDDDGQHRYKIGKILLKNPSIPGFELKNRWIDF